MPETPETPSENKGMIRRFLDTPPDNTAKTVTVAVALCLVASMVVSAAAVTLRPVQDANRLRDKQINVLEVAGVYDPNVPVAEAFAAFEPHVVDLDTGAFADQYDIETFDELATSKDPAIVRALDEDPAGLGGTQQYFQMIYILRDDAGDIDKVVLPVEGYGLWSTLYGFIALEENGNDIYGLQFYQQGETPGLGAEVDNPRWKALWNGKKLRDEDDVLQITVAKTPPAAGREYYVDALAGATLTSNGVDNLVRFWMGQQGFGPFLERLKAGEI
ncbi:Na(+)-translocating NADH-quinone reductase subunit C [Salipiger aestuarii]|uniref:Na(+)-translocating NADH-quinone reductase subunit C n=1 Tax=Salipiger aestuarii TaxID=568098 RepID=A0A327Y1B4_9RHOB|nr:Na(+)-translocating NADH-quinone reductase subunit C [Salipiger aestuarii]KAA8606979.1 Na(+)-translocating NADH-quinone reductase subunit C [Salipiger aestuarii]KAA8610756.1 Na(+)-translocating NADH-quinone reductase subunit C [Salipiger aestuarii]KAB2541508.1 Na(+)-translocating NADH-quinone reductase subunit C [Salipiger aestuarii]RAK14112.1 Na+-transporting NADH:ubiquinone oxidoreductase subunit C [Salipiger aestuarii]